VSCDSFLIMVKITLTSQVSWLLEEFYTVVGNLIKVFTSLSWAGNA
jgi:hypothetical protein